MKVIKKFIAVICSATLVLAAPLTAFAAEPDPVAPSTGTAGAGNVLSYNFDTVVVPTTIKITFNPQKLTIAKRSGEEAVTDQIVSLNYGIASKASQDKKVIVKFAANTALNGESTDVVFVDDEAKITAQANAEDAVGAPNGSHRIYLTVSPATATPTYYEDGEAAGVAFGVTGDRGAKKDNITAARLSDVVMTASEATGAVQTFAEAASSPKNSAYAILGYKLGKATYAAKEDLSFDTTAADVAAKMEMTAVGGVTGFTFGGSMNENTDWTKANLSAIAITPIYELADAGAEVAIEGTASAVTLTETADVAEPDKPLSADGVAAAAFKTTHATILAKTTENVTADDLTAIDTALTAYEALSDEVKALLTTEKALLDDLKTATEALAVTTVTVTYDETNTRYEIALDSGVITDLSDITNLKVNGQAVTATNTNSAKTLVRVLRDNVKNAVKQENENAWTDLTADGDLTFTFTVGTTNYAGTVKRY